MHKKKDFADPYANYSKPESFVGETRKAYNDYDARSGSFVARGDDYGVGHKTPVGSLSQKKECPVPYEKR